MNRSGNALVITILILVLLTAVGIYAVSISTTEMNIALNHRVGTITRNTAESGVYFGIAQLPTIYPAGSDYTAVLTVGTGMTAAYTVQSNITGASVPEPGFGANYKFAIFSVTSSGQAPSGFTGGVRVDADVSYGPVPAGTNY
jgi:Tfp pilus assembly protein PilX